jgi:septal ring factor EnvC (AmiA/AmiB activator)
MHAVTRIRRRLPLALAVVGAVAVTAAVTSFAAPEAEEPPWIADLSAQVTQLSAQVGQLNTSTSTLAGAVAQVDSQTAQLSTKLTTLETKLNQVDSRTIDISTDVQLLKQLANSTHDRLSVVCRNVNYVWSTLETHVAPDVAHLADAHNCWRNYYDPSYAATFSSRWTDPIP